jgi:DNA-binding NarL/FixJ family response regulator
MENTPVLIGIVDDHTLFRSGLSGLLDDLKKKKLSF